MFNLKSNEENDMQKQPIGNEIRTEAMQEMTQGDPVDITWANWRNPYSSGTTQSQQASTYRKH